VAAPVGFDIGSETVAEIAISIVAELISRRNLGPKGLAPRRAVITTEVEPARTGACAG
jgi:xanthine dehydrogenase accessory factor